VDRDQPCTAGLQPLVGRQETIRSVSGSPIVRHRIRIGSSDFGSRYPSCSHPSGTCTVCGQPTNNFVVRITDIENEVIIVTMSAGHISRHRTMSMSSGRSRDKGTLATLAEIAMPQTVLTRTFEPCAATASMFLYAQGNQVVCAHHDTLKVERRFTRHTEEISILAVDTVSDRGAGRLVVSYDVGQTAIVWDCMTGDEVARFASYENLTVASWMRNGNVAFGTVGIS